MINALRRKMIFVSAVAVFLVVSLVYLAIYLSGTMQLNRVMDTLTDVISKNDGRFPEFDPDFDAATANFPNIDNIITPETPFSTRFFTVWVDEEYNFIKENIESISSITGEQARKYALDILERGDERGWVADYRYKVIATDHGYSVVFVDGSMNKTMTHHFDLLVLLVLAGSSIVILLLIILLSRKAVRPAVENYEKQKQFITDANHELKTPLTLILSNLDIVESEFGKNEWLDDIRSEGERMGALINQLVTLTRMDEDQSNLAVAPFDLAAVITDTVSEFQPFAEERSKTLLLQTKPSVVYNGDEGMIRRLISILLDNAVKYCDPDGTIHVALSARRNTILTVENPYKDADSVELDRLFDRFYRADKARNFTGSFGIGLSIARAIAKNHHGDITAYKKGSGIIGFKVVLK